MFETTVIKRRSRSLDQNLHLPSTETYVKYHISSEGQDKDTNCYDHIKIK